MNFEDLFARYREMGIMAPQPSFDKQLFMKAPPNAVSLAAAANASPCARLANSDQPDPLMDNVPAWPKVVGSRDKLEPNMSAALRLPVASMPTSKLFGASLDEEQEQKQQNIGRGDDYDDQELESLLEQQEDPLHSSTTATPAARQQNSAWNLGRLKKNKSCKDYYKLTSNMIHALIMGIKEFTDGEIGPSWQISQNKQQNKNIPCNLLLQLEESGARGGGVSTNFKTTKASSLSSSNTEIEREDDANSFQGKEADYKTSEITKNSNSDSISIDTSDSEGNKIESNLPRYVQPFAKENNRPAGERCVIKDIDNISELRKMLWRQIVPFTCLAEIEKNIKLAQESRMKMINPRSDFGMPNSSTPMTPPSNIDTSQKTNSLCQQPQRLTLNEHHPEMGQDDRIDNADPEVGSTHEKLDVNLTMPPEVEPSSSVGDDYQEETGSRRSPSSEDDGNCDVNECLVDEGPEANDDALNSTEEKYQQRGTDESVTRKPFGQNSNQLTYRDARDMRHEYFRSRSKHASSCAFKETEFAVDDGDQQVVPTLDGDFEIVDRDLDADVPSHFSMSSFNGADTSQLKANTRPKDFHLTSPVTASSRAIRCKENVIPSPHSAIRSWCIMGGFTTRSQTRLT